MEKTTIGVFDSKTNAENAITELRALGITDSDISYLYNAPEGSDVHSSSSGTASGATTGVILGAIAGLVVANGLLPGLGTLFVAGPLAAALGLTGAAATTAAGAMTGLAAGGLLGALSDIGVDSEEAVVYEERVKRGGILLSARSIAGTGDTVKSIFKKYGAEEIREYTTV